MSEPWDPGRQPQGRRNVVDRAQARGKERDMAHGPSVTDGEKCPGLGIREQGGDSVAILEDLRGLPVIRGEFGVGIKAGLNVLEQRLEVIRSHGTSLKDLRIFAYRARLGPMSGARES